MSLVCSTVTLQSLSSDSVYFKIMNISQFCLSVGVKKTIGLRGKYITASKKFYLISRTR